MDLQFFMATGFNLLVNLLFTVTALLIGVLALKFIDDKLLRTINIEEELKNNNIAVAIFASTILIFVAILVAFGMRA